MSCFKKLSVILKGFALSSLLALPLFLYGSPAETYSMLIKSNVKPGRSALDIAVQNYPDAIEYVFHKTKAKIDERDENNKTVLHRINNTTPPKSVKKLIALGFNVNAQDKYGKTPLHYQAENFLNKDIIKILVENGANVNLETHRGKRPRDLVNLFLNNKADNEEVLRLLEPSKQRAFAETRDSLQDPGFLRTCRNAFKLLRFF